MMRAAVVAEARKWLGIPYRPKGRSERGIDCLGLLVVVGRAFAVPHEDQQHYTDYPSPDREMLGVFDRYLERRSISPPWPGLIGVFADRRLPAHVGIFSARDDALHVIHARVDERRVVEEQYDNAPLPRELRVIALYAYPGLED